MKTQSDTQARLKASTASPANAAALAAELPTGLWHVAANHDGGIAPSLDTGARAIAVSQRDGKRIIARLSPARHLFY